MNPAASRLYKKIFLNPSNSQEINKRAGCRSGSGSGRLRNLYLTVLLLLLLLLLCPPSPCKKRAKV